MASKTIATILNLKDNFSAVIKKTTENTKGFQSQVSKTQSSIRDFKSNVAGSFKSATSSVVGFAASYIGVKAVYGYLKEGIEMAKKSEAGVAQLGAVLTSTNNAVGISKQGLLDLAGSYGTYTTYTKGAVLDGENLLLTFTNIGKNVFPQVTTTMLDMSTALKQDVSASAMQLGKALNNPIAGMTALKRVGVAFTDSQVKQITAMQKAGNMVGAQQLILKELNTEFGGSAKAAGQTLPNQLLILQNQFNALKKTVGEKFIPILYSVMQFAVSKMPMIKAFFLSAFNEIDKIITIVVGVFKTKLIPTFLQLWTSFQPTLLKLKEGFTNSIVPMKTIAMDVFNGIKKFVDDNKQAFFEFIDSVKNLGTTIITDLKPTIMDIVNKVLPALKDAFAGNKGTIKDILTAATDTFNFINKNWNGIKPIVESIIGAMIAWKVATMAVATWTGIVTTITEGWEIITLIIKGVALQTSVWTAAQWLLNVAMDANPIGVVIGLIAAIGLAIYEVITHWKEICTWIGNTWDKLKNNPFVEFIALSNPFTGVLFEIAKHFDDITSAISKAWGWLTSWNGTKVKDKKVTTTTTSNSTNSGGSYSGGKAYASGTSNATSGYNLVGENGPEMVKFKGGETVKNASQTKRLAGGHTFIINFNGNNIGTEEFFNQAGEHVVNKLISALGNS